MPDSDSSIDSDSGIRFKTQSVRNSFKNNTSAYKLDRYERRDYYEYKNDKRSSRDNDDRKRHKHSDKDRAHRRENCLRDERLMRNRKPDPVIQEIKKCESPLYKSRVLTLTNNSKSNETSKKIEEESIEDVDSYGPSLPPSKVLQSDISKMDSSISKNIEKGNEIENTRTPYLPETHNEINSRLLPTPEVNIDKVKIYGPTLPSTSVSVKSSDNIMGSKLLPEVTRTYGPLPSGTNISQSINENVSEDQHKSDDEDMIGPLPPGMASNSRVQSELEYRALELKMKLEFPSLEKKSREEWMIELPEVQKVSGLGPRQFRANPAPDMSDRSSWTDTPHDKDKKQTSKSTKIDLKAEAEYLEIQKRDMEQEKIIKNHKKHSKRDKSLMDIHQQALSKKKKESGKAERRPFDRDIDLKLNMLDPSKKSKMLKNACLLDDKFSTGKSKYL